MWVVLNNAFLSIVAHRDKPDTLLVRARVAGDIERVFPDAKVSETRAADYRFRAEIDRRIVSEKLAATAAAIGYDNSDCVASGVGPTGASIAPNRVIDAGYDNFKGSVAEPERHDVYLGVWGLLRKLQR